MVNSVKRSIPGLALATLLLFAGTAQAQQSAKPGTFDYFVLSMSWSPQYCANGGDQKSPAQCGPQRRYGFVLHGLWAQHTKDGWPQYCAPATPVPAAIVDKMLAITPSKSLIQHEWDKHGTCSHLSVDEYFDDAAKAFAAVTVPEPYKNPEKFITTSIPDMTSAFTAVNPGLDPSEIALYCKGPYLAEVRICLGKDFKPANCGSDLHNRCGKTIVVRPLK